jgi:hypothetical protein
MSRTTGANGAVTVAGINTIVGTSGINSMFDLQTRRAVVV